MTRIAILFLSITVCLLVVGAHTHATSATVIGAVVNLRAGPGTQYPVVGQLNRDTKLHIMASADNWHRVQLANGITGWVAAWLIEMETQPLQVVIDAPTVNLRAGPGTTFPILGQAKQGETFALLSAAGDWLKVELASGTTAYIASWLTKKTDNRNPTVDTPVQHGLISITGAVVNLRAGAGTHFSVVGQAKQGEIFSVVAKEGDWVKLELPSGAPAYIASWLTKNTTDDRNQTVDNPMQHGLITITGAVVNLRAGAGTHFSVVGQAKQGETFSVLAKTGDWLKLELPSGQSAYVASWLTQETEQVSIDLFEVPTTPLYGTTHTATVARSSPSTTYSQVAQVSANQRLPVLMSAVGWHQVTLPGNSTGWIEGSLLKLSTTTPHSAALDYAFNHRLIEIKQSPLLQVTGSVVNLRSGPSTGHEVRTTLSKSTQLKIISRSGDWLQVGTTGGQSGWIAAWLTSPIFTPQLREVSIKVANEQQKTLTIEGNFASPPSIFWLEDGKTLAVVTNAKTVEARLDINLHELKTLSVNENGVMLRFTAPPHAEIKEHTANRVTMALGAAVTGFELLSKPEREIVRLHTLGHVVPRVIHDSSGSLRITLPNTVHTGPANPSIPAGEMARSITLGQISGALQITVASAAQARYIVRNYNDYLDVEMLKPGLAGKVIMLDAGHGGPDPGAIGPTGLHEKVPNLEVALRLKQLLAAQGAIVYLTREGDNQVSMPAGYQPTRYDPFAPRMQDLAARAARAEVFAADLYLSIHNNGSVDPGLAGTTTFYHPSNLNSDASKHLAQHLHQALLALGRQDRSVRTMNAAVLRATSQPAVLLEIVYLTNPGEETLLRSNAFLQKAAEQILAGLNQYFAP